MFVFRRARILSIALSLFLVAVVLNIPLSAEIPSGAPCCPEEMSAGPLLRLRGGDGDPTTGTLASGLFSGDLALQPEADSMGRRQYLVQYSGPILSSWRTDLLGVGAEILDYIPDYAYKVGTVPGTVAKVRRLPGVLSVGPYLAGYRLSPGLRASAERATAERQLVRVELASDAIVAFGARLEALGAERVGQEGTSLLVEVDADALGALCREAEVRWISPLWVPRVQNDVATREISATLAWDAGYAGEGQIVNVADTGLDTGRDYPQVVGDMHRDVDNRLVRLRSWPISPLYYGFLNNPLDNDGAADLNYGHGTHVAGSAVGNGYQSGGSYRGVAYRASLTFQAVEQYCDLNAAGEEILGSDGYWMLGIPADLKELYVEAYDWGARVHNNSWGFGDSSVAGLYTVQARQTDRFVWEHRDMVILFAVGNEARDRDHDGIVDQVSVLPPATAKNVIAVGATENYRPSLMPGWPFQNYGQFFGDGFAATPLRDDPMGDAGSRGLWAASGRGPLEDGRLAPHVVAPGSWVISMRSSVATAPGWTADQLGPYYMYLGGTSMSTPLVSGSVTLIRQAYIARGHVPSAALLKATLLQSAHDIPGQYPQPFVEADSIPNQDEGWGALDISAAVAPGRLFVDETLALNTGQQMVYTYTGGISLQPARFTLVWTDYPAALEAAVQLVNDLDLEVRAPSGATYLGGVFAGGWSTPGGRADQINNIESVYLPSTSSGRYVVRVRAHNVPQGPQNYALLVDLVAPNYTPRLALPLLLRNWRAYEPTTTPTVVATTTLTSTLPGLVNMAGTPVAAPAR